MERTKYPRTFHLPWSDGIRPCDRVMPTTEPFHDKEVVITEKMDGESCTMYRDGVHARSINSNNHPSRDWVKAFQAQVGYHIPEGWRVCGENMWAKHSIPYSDLPSYFLGFSIWDDRNRCLNWEETCHWFAEWGIETIPVLNSRLEYQNDRQVQDIGKKIMVYPPREGYVIRLRDSFDFKDFPESVGKFVRKNHVQTDEHWMYGGGGLEKNLLMRNGNGTE